MYFLIRNQKTGSRTKHIAVRYLYGRQIFQQGRGVPYFVRSEENYSDGLTKNLPLKLFETHEQIIMEGSLPYQREDVELALDSMTERNSDGRSYGIPQGSTIEKPRLKIESQSGKAKGGNATSDGIDTNGVNQVDTDGLSKVKSDRLTNYPSPLSLNVQPRGTRDTTSRDGDTFVTTSDNRSSSWTMIQ
jgi:hypothetical protein